MQVAIPELGVLTPQPHSQALPSIGKKQKSLYKVLTPIVLNPPYKFLWAYMIMMHAYKLCVIGW